MIWTLSNLCRRALVAGGAAFALAVVWLTAAPAAALPTTGLGSDPAIAAPASPPGLPDLHAGGRHEGILRRAQKRLGGTDSGRLGAPGDDAPNALAAQCDPSVAVARHGSGVHAPAERSPACSAIPSFLSRAPPVTRDI